MFIKAFRFAALRLIPVIPFYAEIGRRGPFTAPVDELLSILPPAAEVAELKLAILRLAMDLDVPFLEA
jgi:hypothetical protein